MLWDNLDSEIDQRKEILDRWCNSGLRNKCEICLELTRLNKEDIKSNVRNQLFRNGIYW